MVMSKLGTPSRRYVTSTPSVGVSIHVDPDLLDVREVASYTLWSIDSRSSTWQRVRECKPTELPLTLEFREGTTGLWASAKFPSGSESLLPAPGQEPAVWLVVDVTPPSIKWLQPAAGAAVPSQGEVELSWAINELEHGTAPLLLEWSHDRGHTWRSIGEVASSGGHQSHTWKLPSGLPPTFLVRITARDLAGHSRSSVLPLILRDVQHVTGIEAIAQRSARGLDQSRDASAGIAKSVESTGASSVQPAVAADVGTPSGRTQIGGEAGGTRSSGAAAEATPVVRPAELDNDILRLEPLAARVIAGGSTIDVRWTFAPERAGAAATAYSKGQLEWLPGPGSEWRSLGEVDLADGRWRWEVPCDDAVSCRLRLIAEPQSEPPAGGRLESVIAKPFAVDCAAPRVTIAMPTSVVGTYVELPFNVDDGIGSGLESVDVYMRLAAADVWSRLVTARTRLDADGQAGALLLDLSGVPEGAYEFTVQTRDRVGNESDAPHAATEPLGKLQLDKSAPVVKVAASDEPWVDGMKTILRLSAVWSDIAMPIVLEGRTDEGPWETLDQWTIQDSGDGASARVVSWQVPARASRAGARGLTVRCRFRDAAGNETTSTIGPRAVQQAVFLKASPLLARGVQHTIAWQLHPQALADADKYRVQVDFRSDEGKPWQSVCDEVDVRGQCSWDVPGAGAAPRLRLRLTREGEVLSEVLSDVLKIEGGGAPAGPVVSQASRDHYLRAQQFQQELRAVSTQNGGPQSPAVQERWKELFGQVRLNLQQSLEADSKNYRAAYELAVFLRDRGGDDAEVERYLRQALVGHPRYDRALNDLGALYIQREDYASAIDPLERANDIRPTLASRYNLGLAYLNESRVGAAREQFEGAAKLDTARRNGVVYYYLAHALRLEGKVTEAQRVFKEFGGLIAEEDRRQLARSLFPQSSEEQ